jgi:hypothetical protein
MLNLYGGVEIKFVALWFQYRSQVDMTAVALLIAGSLDTSEANRIVGARAVAEAMSTD